MELAIIMYAWETDLKARFTCLNLKSRVKK